MSEIAGPSDATHGDPAGVGLPAVAHAEGGHGDAGHDGHGHGPALGPIDWRAWAAGIVGIAGGLVVVAGLWLATHP